MIVRILGEGRYELPDSELPAMERLDTSLVDAIDRGDEDAFGSTLDKVLKEVRSRGNLLDPDDLRTSSFVVPHEGSTLAEVKELLEEES